MAALRAVSHAAAAGEGSHRDAAGDTSVPRARVPGPARGGVEGARDAGEGYIGARGGWRGRAQGSESDGQEGERRRYFSGCFSDADAGASVIGSVLRRIGRDIAEAAGAVRPDAARANWLETLASVLTAGAETGSCPASDPREICALPAVAGGRVGALKILKTPRALVVARYEEATLGAVAGAQRARLTPAQRLAVDALATHPQRRVLETRLKRSGSDYKRMADAAVLSAFAASPWASFGHIGDVPLEADEAESVAADVYGCLLDGRAPTGPTGRNKAKNKNTGPGSTQRTTQTTRTEASRRRCSRRSRPRAGPMRGALLGPLVSFGFNASGAMSQQDVSDASLGIRPPASVQKGPAGLFEPIAVLLVHGALLASRGVHIDDCHPGREAYARKLERANARAGAGRGGRRMSDGTGSARSSAGRPPRYAESELSDSPVGVITASYGGSSRGSEERRVGAWAEEQATAPAPFGPVSGSEMTVEEEDFHDADDDLPEPPSPVPRHFSRKAPRSRPRRRRRRRASRCPRRIGRVARTPPGREMGRFSPAPTSRRRRGR